MRDMFSCVVLALLAVGCAHHGGNAAAPDLAGGGSPQEASITPQVVDPYDGAYRLWGEWTFLIDETHTKVDVVPRRQGRFHLNALKFLEETCKNCLQVTKIKNNGDGTIDLTVVIKHPFPNHPEYTGFDVKGIIMFNGSYEYPHDTDKYPLPTPFFRISWRELGDPEVINPDGYTPRWSPTWESGSDLPIFNYWEGKYASGVPNAHLNAFLNFYTHEERHMFACYGQVEQDYTIWLPPGEPVIAGYAVEACWEPPIVTPVKNPLEDFPTSANQPEAYYFDYVVNMGEVITDCEGCCGKEWDCCEVHAEVKQWGGLTSDRLAIHWPDWHKEMSFLKDWPCSEEGWYFAEAFDSCHYGNGTHRVVAYNYRYGYVPPYKADIAYDVFDFTVNDPDI